MAHHLIFNKINIALKNIVKKAVVTLFSIYCQTSQEYIYNIQ